MRRPGRTILVAALVAVPVAAMVLAAVWIRTERQSPTEQWRASHGRSDLFTSTSTSADDGAASDGAASDGGALQEWLPTGARAVAFRSDHNRVLRTADGRRASAEVTDLPMLDAMTEPVMQVTSGRAPRRPAEVFLTRAVAADLGASVGDTLEMERPAVTTWTVVGIGERSAWWGSETVVLGPGTPFPWRADHLAAPSVRTVLVDLPADVTDAQLVALSRLPEGVGFAPHVAAGLPGAGRYESGSADDAQKVAWSWVVGAVVLTVVGIVIAAAFAAGARRQLLSLGQLAANGAAPSTLRRVLFLQGTWTGVLGAALGLLLAALVLLAGAPHVDRLLGRDAHPYTVRVRDLVPIVVLGVTAATLAALVPARTTARVPVLAALAGRRPLGRVPAWLTLSGLAVAVGGLALLGLAVLGADGATGATGGATAWALTAVVGGVAVVLSACAMAPGYVSVLEPLGSRLAGASRLAARSLARQRTRTGAVVSAVCATSALAIGAASLVLAAHAKDAAEDDWMRPDEVHLEAHSFDAPALGAHAATQPHVAAVPPSLVADVVAELSGARVEHLRTVGPAAAAPHARWEVREFVPDDPRQVSASLMSVGSGPFSSVAVVADEAFLALYDLPAEARRALATDGVVALGYGSAEAMDGTASIALVAEGVSTSPGSRPPPVEQLVPAFEVRVVTGRGLELGVVPRVVVTPERAGALGLAARPGVTVVRARDVLTDRQRDAIQDIVEEHAELALDAADGAVAESRISSVGASMHYPSAGPSPRLLESLLTAMALALSLFVVAVSLALSAAETRDERDVLAVVGAPPRTMRATSGRKALMLTLLGSLLAVPVGFLPAAVFTWVSDDDLPTVFPWRVVALLVMAVPVVAAVVTTAASGIALRLRPVRVSTMAFD